MWTVEGGRRKWGALTAAHVLTRAPRIRAQNCCSVWPPLAPMGQDAGRTALSTDIRSTPQRLAALWRRPGVRPVLLALRVGRDVSQPGRLLARLTSCVVLRQASPAAPPEAWQLLGALACPPGSPLSLTS